MKAQPEAGSILYGIVHLEAYEKLVFREPEVPDDESGTLTFTYDVVEDPDGEDDEHDEFITQTLSEPIFEKVIVIIDGGEDKKGTGTGHQSEGDSSGGD